jgi:hypothetical protein
MLLFLSFLFFVYTENNYQHRFLFGEKEKLGKRKKVTKSCNCINVTDRVHLRVKISQGKKQDTPLLSANMILVVSLEKHFL